MKYKNCNKVEKITLKVQAQPTHLSVIVQDNGDGMAQFQKDSGLINIP